MGAVVRFEELPHGLLREMVMCLRASSRWPPAWRPRRTSTLEKRKAPAPCSHTPTPVRAEPASAPICCMVPASVSSLATTFTLSPLSLSLSAADVEDTQSGKGQPRCTGIVRAGPSPRLCASPYVIVLPTHFCNDATLGEEYRSASAIESCIFQTAIRPRPS